MVACLWRNASTAGMTEVHEYSGRVFALTGWVVTGKCAKSRCHRRVLPIRHRQLFSLCSQEAEAKASKPFSPFAAVFPTRIPAHRVWLIIQTKRGSHCVGAPWLATLIMRPTRRVSRAQAAPAIGPTGTALAVHNGGEAVREMSVLCFGPSVIRAGSMIDQIYGQSDFHPRTMPCSGLLAGHTRMLLDACCRCSNRRWPCPTSVVCPTLPDLRTRAWWERIRRPPMTTCHMPTYLILPSPTVTSPLQSQPQPSRRVTVRKLSIPRISQPR